ncbi:hypothetical protein [Microbacterium capsulatum]|uniref:Uncharacterized protein n=1 Tax=Microbacterium capsulatum TaxID=3041921 RepID=A0ABU0XG28_9MICO|nr:hypothetical protein [Microbacterium sp. ASV81]MDQ4214074.1 hypothetical protein [Microbacterium sp. ASV81]
MSDVPREERHDPEPEMEPDRFDPVIMARAISEQQGNTIRALADR